MFSATKCVFGSANTPLKKTVCAVAGVGAFGITGYVSLQYLVPMIKEAAKKSYLETRYKEELKARTPKQGFAELREQSNTYKEQVRQKIAEEAEHIDYVEKYYKTSRGIMCVLLSASAALCGTIAYDHAKETMVYFKTETRCCNIMRRAVLSSGLTGILVGFSYVSGMMALMCLSELYTRINTN